MIDKILKEIFIKYKKIKNYSKKIFYSFFFNSSFFHYNSLENIYTASSKDLILFSASSLDISNPKCSSNATINST